MTMPSGVSYFENSALRAAAILSRNAASGSSSKRQAPEPSRVDSSTPTAPGAQPASRTKRRCMAMKPPSPRTAVAAANTAA